MALTARTAFDVAGQPGFHARVKFFMQKAAIAVMAEASSTEGHSIRMAFAGQVLNGSFPIRECAIAVMTNSTLQAEGTTDPETDNGIPDSDLEFAVNSMFSAFSGFDPN